MDAVSLHVLFRETNSRLDALSKSVDECRNLDAALDFTRYLLWSGIIKLLKANSSGHPLPVDGSLIEYKATELQRAVQHRYRTSDTQPHLDLSELSRINYKLDLIAGQLSQLPVPKVDIALPPLTIVGLD